MNTVVSEDVMIEGAFLPNERQGSLIRYAIRDMDNYGRKVKEPFLAIKVDGSDWIPALFLVDRIKEESERCQNLFKFSF